MTFDEMNPLQRRLHNAALVLEAEGDDHGFAKLQRDAIDALQPNTQEPSLYQSRIRPAWKDDADWLAWETCSKESAEDYERKPLLHDWQYQVRRLHTHPAPQKPAEPLTRRQVDEILAAHGYEEVQERCDFIAGLRHGEAAHNIGVKP